MLTLDKSKFKVYSEISDTTLTDWSQDKNDKKFVRFTYFPDFDKVVINDYEKDAVCENLYQK